MQIKLAHSPDSDDAFMFYALACGRLETGPYRFKHILADIETLNRAAEKGEYHVSAISLHAYPFISHRYQLLSCGASVGEDYGPMVVTREPYTLGDFQQIFRKQDESPVIGVPGEKTTAFLVLKLLLRDFHYQVMPFDEILPAVREKRVDAGLIIHEGQLTYQQDGLKKVVDLGSWWKKEMGLPLPLGANVIRRNLGKDHIEPVARLIRKSIEFSLDPANQSEALEYALQFARGLDQEQATRFVHMYVNQKTVYFDDACKKATERLYQRAVERGLIPSLPPMDFVTV